MAWFQHSQWLPDHQACKHPHTPSATSWSDAGTVSPCLCQAGGYSKHLRREHSGSGKLILEASRELTLSSANVARPPHPSTHHFPQTSCFWVKKLIFQPSVRWSVRGGLGWKQKKQQPWSQGWRLQIPQGFNHLQIYRSITVENCLLAEFRAALGPRGLLAAAVCEPLYLSNAMFPKSVVLKWWERAKEGDSCPGYTDNEIHRNQISPKHANNIPAGACLSSRAGFGFYNDFSF